MFLILNLVELLSKMVLWFFSSIEQSKSVRTYTFFQRLQGALPEIFIAASHLSS